MFRLGGRKRETREMEKSPPVLEEITSKDKMVDYVSDLVKQGGASPSASVRSILKAAISSAEQIVESVRQRAEEEAKEEAARIVAQARREAEGLSRGVAIPDSMTETVPTAKEEIEEAAGPVAEEKGAVVHLEKPEEETLSKDIPEAALTEKEEAAAEAEVQGLPEQSLEAERPEEKEGEAEVKDVPEAAVAEKEKPATVGEASQAIFTGEVEIVVGVPVDPNIVTKLYGYLQTTPQIKFVRTAGSWNKGTSISVVLEKKIPLVAELTSRIPEAMITGQPPEPGKKEGSRVDITLKSK